MKRIYKKVDTNYLLKMHKKESDEILEYLPKTKRGLLFELLEIERELTQREE